MSYGTLNACGTGDGHLIRHYAPAISLFGIWLMNIKATTTVPDAYNASELARGAVAPKAKGNFVTGRVLNMRSSFQRIKYG
ncbi:hypothetical protein OHC33_007569 [Knufia fluminis]|uniref:Uncharacterized protein n=1 Tax=Knufia fluminis TaxID=191047 RepID=A0AAN8EBY1_9EURO|nr:hypothetical protein OHC33_007569 [Knufia fluminis]